MLFISNKFLAFIAAEMRFVKNDSSMRSASLKLQTRARIFEVGLNAAQPKNWPSWLSTRTVSPGSPAPVAMAPSKIQGWRRSKDRSLPSFSRIDFMGLLSRLLDMSCGGDCLRTISVHLQPVAHEISQRYLICHACSHP